MPRAYSEDLRLPAVWLHFFLGYDNEETAGLLAMSVRTVERYLRKQVCRGEVIVKKPGRPVDLVGMHPREELAMMEAMLEHGRLGLPYKYFSALQAVLCNRYHGSETFHCS